VSSAPTTARACPVAAPCRISSKLLLAKYIVAFVLGLTLFLPSGTVQITYVQCLALCALLKLLHSLLRPTSNLLEGNEKLYVPCERI
jgi:hypothetical protein